MKKIHFLVPSVFLAFILAFAGCQTIQNLVPTTGAQVLSDAALLQVGAKAAVDNTINNYPETVPYYQLGVEVIDGLLNTTNYSPSVVSNALVGLKINEIQNSTVQKNIASVIQLYQAKWSSNVAATIDKNAFAPAFLIAFRNGLAQGLGLSLVPLPTAASIDAILHGTSSSTVTNAPPSAVTNSPPASISTNVPASSQSNTIGVGT